MNTPAPWYVNVALVIFLIAMIPFFSFLLVTFYADTRRVYAKKGDSFKTVIRNMLNTSSD
jgi:hypothetical protein